MIPAVEALALSSAQLSDAQKTEADKLEAEIEKAVRGHMARNGLDMTVKQADPAIIAEVNQRLRAVGWSANWTPLTEEHRLNKAMRNIIGYGVSLFPSDDSYRAHQRSILS